jgi:hypothetical protein
MRGLTVLLPVVRSGFLKRVNMSRWYARAASRPVLKPVNWHVSNRIFLTTFIGILGAVYIFILLVDPYGVVPFSLPFERPIMSSQRQTYPQILRSGRYDSIVVGTSTSRLLDPLALDRALGGHFASLAMPSATAWEQVQVIDYFRRTVATPRAVLIGLDHEWCHRDSSIPAREEAQAREKEFPAWAYDGNRWNDLLYLLNDPTLEVAARVVGRLLGRVPQKLREDGFEVFVPPDAAYDPARAHAIIWGAATLQTLGAILPPAQWGEAERSSMTFEALPWLDQSLAALPDATRKILVFPPVHVHMLPTAGSYGEAREAECKARVTAIARRRGASLVDWRIVSPLSTEDSNFWDPLHYRLPIAYSLIDDLEHVINEGRESPDGRYRILVR